MIRLIGGAAVLVLVAASDFRVTQAADGYRLPVVVNTLSNGLTVAISEEHANPSFGLSIAYKIGFRLEPKGRSGFAHLFEHMMFQGTSRVPQGTLERIIEGGGGQRNGHTRYDYTEFVASGPISLLEPVMWLEADRMSGLAFSVERLRTQIDVVKEEIRTNVLNRPYSLFYALDLPRLAFQRHANSHNFYGEFSDLDAVTVDNLQAFYRQYYGPNNAVLAIAGDVTPSEALRMASKYFGRVPRRPSPRRPDVQEGPQTIEKRAEQYDELAKTPAMAIGYRMPVRTLEGAAVAATIGRLLHDGEASRLHQTIVQTRRQAMLIDGGVNWPQGNQWAYGDPALLTSLIVYRANVSSSDVLASYDDVVRGLGDGTLSAADLERMKIKMRSDWYGDIEHPQSRASLLATFIACWGTADGLSEMPASIDEVSLDRIRAFAARHLTPANRTVITRLTPGAKRSGETRQ